MGAVLLKKKAEKDLSVSVFSSVKDIEVEHWERVCRRKNIYFTLAYLEAIEAALKASVIFRYLIFYNTQQKAVSIAVVQVLPFFDKGNQDEDQLCSIRKKVKNSFLATSGIRVMTCGSPFACGENGFLHTEEISTEEAYFNLSKALVDLQKLENKILNAPVIVAKEFWPKTNLSSKALKSNGFKDFKIDVNMVMHIPESWTSFEDYLFSMVTKFRTKAKSAFKKSSSLRIIDFNEEDILVHEDKIEKLYQLVLEKSSFKFGSLNKQAFVYLKQKLKDQFAVRGYFLNEELVGFSSAFVFNGILDANYVGIDYTFNQDYAIYQRMLYDYVDLAIRNRCREVRFGRTAEEIKSSVGATPVDMTLFIRHQNSIKNVMLKPVFGSIQPSSFEQRYPFKAVYNNR